MRDNRFDPEAVLAESEEHSGVSPYSAVEFQRVMGKRVYQSLRIIRHLQHTSGEILSFRKEKIGYVYCRSPFVSALVHEALACFDPTSSGWLDSSLDLVPSGRRKLFVSEVAEIRCRIRDFLSWQKESQGWWRFFGRGSGIDPDVNSTIYAILALRDAPGNHHYQYWDEQLDTVNRFRSADNLYYTFYRPGRGGYGWMDEKGRPVVGFDRVVNADVLWFLNICAPENHRPLKPLSDYLLRECDQPGVEDGTFLYPNPVSFYYSLSRAWRGDFFNDQDGIRKVILPKLLAMQGKTGEFGGPISTAMAANTLVNLRYLGPEMDRARFAIVKGLQPGGGWRYEDFIVNGFGSPALTTALSLSYLAHFYRVAEGFA